MNSLEKELCFFNENKESLSSKSINYQDKSSIQSELRKIIPTNSFIANFKSKFKVTVSSFLLISSFILFLLALAASITLNHGNLPLFMVSVFANICGTFFLFDIARNLNKKENNLHSRLLFKKHVEDIEYIVSLFEKKFDCNVRYEFSNGYTAKLYLYVKVESKEYKFQTLYLDVLEKIHPADLLKRMEWSFQDVLELIEKDCLKEMLIKIKNENKDMWFSLGNNPSKKAVLDIYTNLFSKATS